MRLDYLTLQKRQDRVSGSVSGSPFSPGRGAERQVKVYFCHKCSLDYEDVPFLWKFTEVESRGIPRGIGKAEKRLIIRKMGTPLPQRSTSNRSCRPRRGKEAHAP